MINFAICDDSSRDRDDLTKKLFKLSNKMNIDFNIIEYSKGTDLLKNITSHDIIFLDIVMDELDGIEVLKQINNHDVMIIFMSTTSDRLRELYDQNVIAFLDKPINESELEKSFVKAQRAIQKNHNETFVFKKNGKLNIIKINDIVYIEVIGHYINIYKTNEIITFKGKLKEVWDNMSLYDCFIMPNRSFIINMKYVSISSKTEFIVENYNVNIKISRNNKTDTIKKFMNYISLKGCGY